MRGTANVFVLALLALAAAAGTAGAQGEKFKLQYKAEAGQVARYQSEGTISLEAGGMKVAMEIKETEKVTFTAVSPAGEITMERQSESTEISVNGMKIPTPDRNNEKSTLVIRPDGVLVSHKSTDTDAESGKLGARVFQATNPVFPDRELGVGDKWSHEYKASTESGAPAAKGDFEVLAVEKKGGVDTVKVKMTYRESDSNPPVTCSGTFWAERTSGDSVFSEVEVENMPFGGGGGQALANAKIKQERIAGGPLGGAKTADGKPAPPKVKTIDDIVKDFEKLPGLFDLFRKKEAGRETIYAEVKQEQLGKLFLLQATASTGMAGNVIAGDPLNDILFKLVETPDEKVLMVTPNISFQASDKSPIARSVQRSFAPGYLESFKIEARQPERKSLLINISELFRNDIAQVGLILGGGGGGLSILGLGGGASYSLDKEKTYVATMKVFPENMFVQTSYHFQRGGRPGFGGGALADPRSVPLKVNFNLFQLADKGYRPRVADPRVGFFYTEYQDFTDDGKDSQMLRYVLRWDVRKADPSAALSPPKEPIVFWLDNAIPTEYRDAVRDGILMWSKAFEKIGIKDAIVVKQMPDDAEWDHADMRYNVIRWSTTYDPPYGAVALFRVNPLTGQIINAGITVDASLTRFNKLEKRELVDPAAYFTEMEQAPKPAGTRPFSCDLAPGAIEQAWLGSTALSLLEPKWGKVEEKQYTNDFVRAIVAHEFGHILGLFHNFAASTQLSMEELKDPKLVRQSGVTGSVMDYPPFNLAALKQKNVDYWSPTIGAYDTWAVQYGYTPIESKTPDEELPRLKAIASKGNLPGNAYKNDFIADQFDPLVARFDLSREPLEYFTRKLQVNRYMLLNLEPRLPKKGESYWQFTRAFNILLGDYSRSAAFISRYIGGLHVNYNFRGDANEKPTLQPIDPQKQRQALETVNRYIFSENAFSFPRSYYTRFTPDPFPSIETFIMGGMGSQDFPVRDQVTNIQRAALRRLFNGAVLTRVLNNEFKSGETAALTLPALFRSVANTVWSELDSGKNVGALRRHLQRTHLDLMVQMVVSGGGAPDDARMLAWDRLRQLKAKLMAIKRPALDEYTRVHFDESLMRVQRALNAVQTIGGAGAPAVNPLQFLLGGERERKAEDR